MAVVKVPITREITGHKAVREALRNTKEFSSDLQGDADVRDYRQLPLEVDPPRHHLYRAALTPYFVKPAVEKHIHDFQESSEQAIKKFFSQEKGEVVSQLALPLVMQNLGILYGRQQDVEEWISWGPDVWTAAGPMRSGEILHAYLDRVYKEAIQSPSDDIWSKIAHLVIGDSQITAIEFKGIAGVMLAGGRDTVVKLLSGIIWHFAKTPEDLELLRTNPDLIEGAIQELLRFLTPLPAMARTTVPESSVSQLPDDRYVQISFLSGNFDREVFENPYSINLKRIRNPHLSFGFGPHTCLGNHVAEIEAKVFLKALISSGLRWELSDGSQISFYEDEMADVPNHIQSLWVARS